MSKAGAAGGAANDAEVSTVAPAEPERAALERAVVEADKAVELIEAKMDGWQQSLDAAKAAAETAYQRLDEAGN